MESLHYALIGNPLGHSMSAVIHEKLFATAKTQADYRLLPIASDALAEEAPRLSRLCGYNVTIPHKRAIIPYLSSLSEKAALYGAVNTVKCGAEARGYNTDCDGFLRALESAGIPLRGEVLVCGAGGVARMMAFESALHGCRVTIATREKSAKAAMELAAEIREKVLHAQVCTCLFDEVSGAFDLLVNGTPVGMYPNPGAMAVPAEVVKSCGGVFDTVYNPLETQLVRTAKAMGIPGLGGLSMLVWQAAAAQEIWNPVTFTKEEVQAVIEETGRELTRQFGGNE